MSAAEFFFDPCGGIHIVAGGPQWHDHVGTVTPIKSGVFVVVRVVLFPVCCLAAGGDQT